MSFAVGSNAKPAKAQYTTFTAPTVTPLGTSPPGVRPACASLHAMLAIALGVSALSDRLSWVLSDPVGGDRHRLWLAIDLA
jgi:hypothetical protein